MSWHGTFEGQSANFIPELLTTRGNPGRLAAHARSALWELLQGVTETNPSAYVKVTTRGVEDPDNPGFGEIHLKVEVVQEPGEIQKQLVGQQPLSLLDAKSETSTDG